MDGVSFAISRQPSITRVRSSMSARGTPAAVPEGIELGVLSPTVPSAAPLANSEHGHTDGPAHHEHRASEVNDWKDNIAPSVVPSWNSSDRAFNSFHLVKASTDSIESVQVGEND